jgi:hypothetical protein
MTCIWRIHGSKPSIFRWNLVYNTSVICFSHFHLEGVGGWSEPNETQGRIQDFKLGGAHLRKSRRAEGGANIFGVFRVKNHDLTTKNHIFSNCRGRRENFWGISCEKSRFYAKKSFFFQL